MTNPHLTIERGSPFAGQQPKQSSRLFPLILLSSISSRSNALKRESTRNLVSLLMPHPHGRRCWAHDLRKAVVASEWPRSDVSAAVVSCMSVSVRSFRSTKSRPPPARRPLELLVACGRVETHELERVLERQVAHLAGGELGQEHASRFDRSTDLTVPKAVRSWERMFARLAS